MSLLDILLSVITILLLSQSVLLKKNLHHLLGWLAIDIVIIVCHVLFDQLRWQVIMMYSLPVMTFLYYFLSHIELVQIKIVFRKTLIVLLILLNMMSVLATMVFPIPVLVAPEGPYNVGTTVMNLEDHSRKELYGEGTGNREIRLQVWYPAVSETSKISEKWIIDGEATLSVFAEVFGFPKFFMTHLRDVRTHSYLDIPASDVETSYPLIVISHGWSSMRNMHNNYAEMLASHGYIVVGIDHTYSSAVTRLEDGRIAKHDPTILPETDFLDEAFELIQVYSGDIEFVINNLIELNKTHRILKDKLDMKSIGLLGHSTGAGADVYYSMTHDVQAIVGMDPWVEPIENIETLETPFMAFRSEEWENGTNDVNLSKVTTSVYQIDNSKHQDFSMVHMISPYLKLFGLSGGDTSEIQLDFILNFFDENLKNKSGQEAVLKIKHKSVNEVNY